MNEIYIFHKKNVVAMECHERIKYNFCGYTSNGQELPEE